MGLKLLAAVGLGYYCERTCNNLAKVQDLQLPTLALKQQPYTMGLLGGIRCCHIAALGDIKAQCFIKAEAFGLP